jgi:hypothetical protein
MVDILFVTVIYLLVGSILLIFLVIACCLTLVARRLRPNLVWHVHQIDQLVII